MSIGRLTAPPLTAAPTKKVKPPKNMMFLRPMELVRRLAISEVAKPAMYSEDVKAVKAWLSYKQYMFDLATALDFFSMVGKNFLRNAAIVVTPPIKHCKPSTRHDQEYLLGAV